MNVLLRAIIYGNVKSTHGVKQVEDQEEQKKKENHSKPQKLADKEQLSLEYFSQSSSAGRCHP